MKLRLSTTFFLLLILCTASLCLLSILRLLIIPSDRVGIFGIGLPAKTITYGDSSSNFVIEHPESWVIHESFELKSGQGEISATINVPGRSFPKVDIKSVSNSVDHTTEIVDYRKRELTELSDYTEISLKQFSTSHYQGYRREYSWAVSTWLGRVKVHCEDYYFSKDMNGYVATFCAEDKHWQIVKDVFWQMISSFIIN